MRYVTLLTILATAGTFADASEWTSDDFARVTVVAPAAPSAVEQKAVDQFVAYWERCAGHRPSVAAHASNGPAVWIGTAVPQSWRNEAPVGSLGTDGVAMAFHDDGDSVQLALYGGPGKGTLYAVYEFFERYFGVRWFAPEAVVIPAAPSAIMDVHYAYAPPFAFRSTPVPTGGDDDVYRQSSGFTYGLGGHSLYDLLPPEQYFAEHPEYYSEIRGKRIAPIGIDWTVPNVASQHHEQLGQLCMTNPDVAVAIAESLKAKIAERPDADVWSVAQMDWGNACRCAACSALVEQEGTDAAPMLMGVNRVAELLEPVYPEIKLQTYAYTWTRKPPKTIRPHKNVLVQLCTFECDFARPLTDPASSVNRTFMRDLAGWQALGANLLIYDYPINCRNPLRPSPTDGVLGSYIRTFADAEVLGVFEQGRAGVAVAFGYLKPYLISKLLWDPSLDTDAICREFIDAFYGKAAPFMFDYLMLTRETLRAQGVQMFLFDDCGWITRGYVEKAQALFRDALAAAETDVIRKRVELDEVQVLYAAMLAGPDAEYLDDRVIVRRPPRMAPETLHAHIASFGMADHWGGWVPTFDEMKKDYNDGPDREEAPLVTLENDQHRIWILPEQFGSVVRWHDTIHNRELLKGFESFGARTGSWQDWEDRNTMGERPVAREYRVTDRGPGAVTMEAATEQGLTVRRTMRFGADPAELEVELTMVNTTAAAQPVKVKIHPEFHCQRVNSVPQIWLKEGSDWTHFNKNSDSLETVRGEFIIPDTATAWAFFVEEEGYGLLNEFRKEELSRTLFYYNTGPGSEQINLELLPLDAPLSPGEARTIHSRYRIITAPPNRE